MKGTGHWNETSQQKRAHLIKHGLHIILLNSRAGRVNGFIDHTGTSPRQKKAYSYYRQSFLSPMTGKQQSLYLNPQITRVDVISPQDFSWMINTYFTTVSERDWAGGWHWRTFRGTTSASFCRSVQELFYLAAETEAVWGEEEVHDSFISALLCALAWPQTLSLRLC